MFKFSALILPMLLIVILLKWIQKKQLAKLVKQPFAIWNQQYKIHEPRQYFTVIRDKMCYDFVEKSLWAGECLQLFDTNEIYPLIEKASKQEEAITLFKTLYQNQLPLLTNLIPTQYSSQEFMQLPAEVIGAYLLTLENFPPEIGQQKVLTHLAENGLMTDFNSNDYIRPIDDFSNVEDDYIDLANEMTETTSTIEHIEKAEIKSATDSSIDSPKKR